MDSKGGLAALLGALVFVAACGEVPTAGVLDAVSVEGVTINGQAAKSGQKIGLKDKVVVATAAGFARIKLDDGTRLFLHPDPSQAPTTFSVETYQAQGSGKTMLLKLWRGVCTLVVDKKGKGDVLEVEASHTTTAIRGTQLKVESGDSGDRVSVKEGEVEVRSTSDAGTTETIRALEQVTFQKSAKPTRGKYESAMSDAEDKLYWTGAGRPTYSTN